MRKFWPKLWLSVALILIISSTAVATPTHVTPGNKGTESTTSHTYNPGHIWLVVGSSNAGDISSGGRYHDRCASTRCFPGNGGDWALDINSTANDPTLLYVDMYGYSSGGVGVDLRRDITITAMAKAPGNYRTGYGSDPACAWQEYQITAAYTGNDGKPYTAQVGSVFLAHQKFDYKVDTSINWNASRGTGYGGTIRYINGVKVGTVYPDADKTSASYGKLSCSTGDHTHIEFLSKHGFGRAWEWHSDEGPDGYSEIQAQPTDLNIAKEYSDHLHYPSSYEPPTSNENGDKVTPGVWLGNLGGSSTSPYMEDNPNSADH